MEEVNVAIQKIENCLDCKHHALVPDPDPDDWFCDDDEAVLCKETPNPTRDVKSKWASDRQPFRAVTRSSRPYQTRRDSKVPDWCPLLEKNKI